MWVRTGLVDYLKGAISIHQAVGDIAEITLCMSPDNVFSTMFDWCRSDLYSDKLDALFYTNPKQRYTLPQIRECLFEHFAATSCVNVGSNVTGGLEVGASPYQYLFVPKQAIEQKLSERVASVVSGDYDVIHARLILRDTLGKMHFDEKSKVDGDILQKALRHIDEIIATATRPLVLVTDSVELIDTAPQCLLRSGSIPIHSFNKAVTEQGAIDVLTDLRFIRSAKSVTCLSNLPWGSSGFSRVTSRVFGVEYKAIKL